MCERESRKAGEGLHRESSPIIALVERTRVGRKGSALVSFRPGALRKKQAENLRAGRKESGREHERA
jgi:hypothetical protein